MRRVWLLVLFVAAACGEPKVQLARMRFSKLERSSPLHANIDVTFDKSARDRNVPLVCTLTGPQVSQKVEQSELLPREFTAMTWHVAFAPPSSGWAEGRYQVACETAASSVKGGLEFSNSEPESAPAPQPSFSLSVIPELYGSSSEYGDPELTGDEFDSASLKYIVYKFQTPPASGSYRLKGCVIERLRTGVKQVPNSKTEMKLGGNVSILGTAGFAYPGLWLPGEYELRCDMEGFSVAPRRFRVVGEADPDTRVLLLGKSLPIPKTRVESIDFMEFANEPPPIGQRAFYSQFEGDPRFIGTEVKFALEPLNEPRSFNFRCQYFTSRGGLIGGNSIDLTIPPGETGYHAWISWGNLNGNYWRTGAYYVECDCDGMLLASRYFTVER